MSENKGTEAVKSTISNVGNSSFMKEVKKVLLSTLRIFVKPEDVLKQKSVSKAWLITMIFQSIAIFLAFVLGLETILSLVGDGFGFSGFGLGDLEIPFGVYVKFFFAGAVISFGFLFILSLAIFGMVKLVLKADYKFMDIVNKFSYLSLIISVAVLGFVLGGFIHQYLGIAILGFGLVYYLLTTFVFIKEMFKMDINKSLLFTTLIILITVVLGNVVVQKTISVLFESIVKSALGGF